MNAQVQPLPAAATATPRKRRLLGAAHVPLATTIALFVAMGAFGSFSYTGFFSAQVFLNLTGVLSDRLERTTQHAVTATA